MNDIAFFQGYFWVTVYQDSKWETRPAFLRLPSLRDFGTERCVDLYDVLGMKGVPYFFSWVDGKLCIPEIDTYSRIVLYDVDGGEVKVNRVLYDFGESEPEDIIYRDRNDIDEREYKDTGGIRLQEVSMDWTDITTLVNEGKWEQAREGIDKLKGEIEWNDTAAIVEAAVCQYENNETGAYECIANGLKYNYRNYELYVMLGNYYQSRNIDQAYLCYENAEFYCDVKEDREYIRQCLETARSAGGNSVMPVSIVLVSYNNCEMMQDCIQSIRDTNPQSAYELVVVDNASDDGVAEWLEEQEDVVLIRNEDNKGFGYGCNQGVKAAKPDNDIFFLNNDTLLPPNAVFWLRMGLYEHERVGAVSSTSNYAGNEQQIQETCNGVQEYMEYGKKNNVPDKNPYEKKVWLCGFALMLKRRALDETGLFDLRYGKGYYEDNDLGIRLRYAGYHLLLCRNSFIFHYGSQSFGQGVKSAKKIFEKSLVFQDKWGFNTDNYTYPRLELLNFITEDKNMPIRVLEIGCGAGMMLSRIKYLWPESVIKGIEPEEKPALLGKDYLGVEWGNAETMELPYEKDYFDYIIFSHALETFYSPEKVIKRFRPYLKDSGRMLFRIFNVMHVSVLLSMLNGKFFYSREKAMENAHIRFFAFDDVSQMMDKCELAIEDLQGLGEETIMNSLPKERSEGLCRIAGKNKELLQVYEYLVKAKKK